MSTRQKYISDEMSYNNTNIKQVQWSGTEQGYCTIIRNSTERDSCYYNLLLK